MWIGPSKMTLKIFVKMLRFSPFILSGVSSVVRSEDLDCGKFSPSGIEKFLQMDYATFDSDDKGWRRYPYRNPQCVLEMGKVQDAYLQQNSKKLTARQIMLTKIHQGQFYAQAGLKEVAISRLKSAFYPKMEPDDKIFLKGFIAFMQNDRVALNGAKQSIESLKTPRSESMKKVIDKYIECFGHPYEDIFLPRCQSQNGQTPTDSPPGHGGAINGLEPNDRFSEQDSQ
jgi:hypothetical protein